jgi:hypothetical protein
MFAEGIAVARVLHGDRIREALSTRTVGGPLCLHGAVRSTDETLRPPGVTGAAERTIVFAKTQAAGQGRTGEVRRLE